MFMRTDLLPSILISEFYIQLASSFHMKCTVCRNKHSTWRITILQSIAPRLQTVYMHPDYLQSTPPRVYNSTNPQEPFFLENMQILQEETRATFCSTRTRILPEKVLMLQASNGTVRVLCI